MSKDVYHEMFVHLTWHTKDSRAMIAPEVEQNLHDLIRRRAVQPGGVFIHEIGGTDNHVHLVARVNPTVLISEWVGKTKGGSSHDFNETGPARRLDWQSGYGVVTFGLKDLDWVIQYVRNQKEHHRTGNVFARLERIDTPEGTG